LDAKFGGGACAPPLFMRRSHSARTASTLSSDWALRRDVSPPARGRRRARRSSDRTRLPPSRRMAGRETARQ
jgi:hypothetical protein